MFGFGLYKILGAAAIGATLIGGVYYYGYRTGAEAERVEALENAIEQIRERSETNEEVSKMDDAGLCAAIGGVFEDGKCR